MPIDVTHRPEGRVPAPSLRRPPRAVRWIAGSIAAVAACLPVLSARAQELDRQVSSVIDRARLSGAAIGVEIVDVQSGRELASVKKNDYFIPASNMKLLTSAAALSLLGPDFEFRTEIRRVGDRLVVRGCGDPAFADPVLLEEMGVTLAEFMSRLAQGVADSGMTRVSEIIVDDRIFDRDYVHPDWPRNQLDNAYCAEVSGLNFHTNVLSVYASPGAREGEPAVIRVEPDTRAVEIRKKARTVRGSDASTRIGAVRQGMDNIFVITGTVSSSMRKPAENTLHEASLVMGRMLAERLAALGVGAEPPKPVGAPDPSSPAPVFIESPVRLATRDEELDKHDGVLAIVRTPISVVLERCNSDSENLYAESLCKLMGNFSTGLPGTWGSGASATRMQIRDRLGPEFATALFIADGSGLSRSNRVTPALLGSWLASMAADPRCGPTLIQSLPRAGMEGTMAHRFRNKPLKNEVRGKSGYINGVRTLSGFVTNIPTQRRVAFSILVNDIPASGDAKAKELHEDIVQVIDQWLTKQCKDAPPLEKVGG